MSAVKGPDAAWRRRPGKCRFTDRGILRTRRRRLSKSVEYETRYIQTGAESPGFCKRRENMRHRNSLTRRSRAALLLLAVIVIGSCRKDSAEVGRSDGSTVLSIAEVNWGGTETKAVAGGGGTTTFTDGDRLGLFLRGEGYAAIDNRPVVYEYASELWKKWVISGEDIRLEADEATVTGYFPYNASEGLQMSSMPLVPGPYDVNMNDFVWQRDRVSTTNPQAMFLGMKHALTRIRLTLKNAEGSSAASVGMIRIADAAGVPEPQQVIYTDGTIDLTRERPMAVGGGKGPLSDMTAKRLSDQGTQYDMLLIPVTSVAERAVTLQAMVDDELLYAYFPTDKVDEWEAGKAYAYEVAVNENAIQIKYGGGDVQDWGQNGWGFDIGDPDPVQGTVQGTIDPDPTTIPQPGGKYTAIFTGEWNGNLPVRVIVGGDVLTTMSVACVAGGGKTSFTIPENTTYDRPVTFEYELEGKWITIALGTQKGAYEVIGATTDAPETIPQGGGTYTVTLTGTLPASVAVRAVTDSTVLATGTVTKSGTAATMTAIGANASYSARGVTVQYRWDGDWIAIKTVSQSGYGVTAATNAPATIPQAGGTYTVTLTGQLPASGLKVRAVVGAIEVGTVVNISEGKASVTIGANNTYTTRTVQFQYLWNGVWTNVTSGSRTQNGYLVTSATHNAGSLITNTAKTITVSITGTLPVENISVQVMTGSKTLTTGTATGSTSSKTVSVTIPANTGAERTITIHYMWNGEQRPVQQDIKQEGKKPQPAGTIELTNVYIDRSYRSSRTYQEAKADCASLGGRLPSTSEVKEAFERDDWGIVSWYHHWTNVTSNGEVYAYYRGYENDALRWSWESEDFTNTYHCVYSK